MGHFFSRLSFSFGNEDWLTEQKALQIAPDSRVMCITASGDRSLNLLLNPCNMLVSLDANPIQTHLLQLKRAAMEKLDARDYLAFLGATPSSSRLSTLEQLSPSMYPEAAVYWAKNRKMVDRGILFQGFIERFVKIAKVPVFFRRKEVRGLFACQTLEEQKRFLAEQWTHSYWKWLFKWGIKPCHVNFTLRDPGISTYREKGVDPGSYIYDRMIRCFDHCLARESILASLILLQTVEKEAYPPYLTLEGIRAIKPHLNRLTPITQEAISYLEEIPECSFDRFSLSDISSYLDRRQFERLLKAIFRTARPGARFCLRQLMTRYAIPAELSPYFRREPALEQQLEAEDRAFVYHFTVGSIVK